MNNILVVAGCLSQRYGKDLLNEIPEIDILIGTSQYYNINNILKKYFINKEKICNLELKNKMEDNLPRKLLTPNYYAYLKISEGCNNYCTYCIIPKLRGRYKSRRIEDIVKEANELSKNGVKEIILIAQDTSKYGLDLYDEKKLHEVISQISKINGIEWIRIHYLYPEDFYEELFEQFKYNDKLLKYFDIPIQHINNDILKKMNRKTTRKEILNLIHRIRTEIKDSIIRTSLITGFPNEAQKEHNELKEFLYNEKLDRVGIFKYSREEDTPAYKFNNQIEESIKEKRRNELMEIQQNISYENNNKRIGCVYKVLVEEEIENGLYSGRTYMDSPGIDGITYIKTNNKLIIGEFYNIVIKEALEYDLIGELYIE